jgi:hypothetical protein
MARLLENNGWHDTVPLAGKTIFVRRSVTPSFVLLNRLNRTIAYWYTGIVGITSDYNSIGMAMYSQLKCADSGRQLLKALAQCRITLIEPIPSQPLIHTISRVDAASCYWQCYCEAKSRRLIDSNATAASAPCAECMIVNLLVPGSQKLRQTSQQANKRLKWQSLLLITGL